jgi:hypothetical protein
VRRSARSADICRSRHFACPTSTSAAWRPPFWSYAAAFLVMAAVTWFFYLRSSFAVQRVSSLAHANV